jgi:hypothetical protein
MSVDYMALFINYLHCIRRIIERYFSRALSVKLTLLLTFQGRVEELLETFLFESLEILQLFLGRSRGEYQSSYNGTR